MLMSYILSRTLVATLAKYWLHKHELIEEEKNKSRLARLHEAFEKNLPYYARGMLSHYLGY